MEVLAIKQIVTRIGLVIAMNHTQKIRQCYQQAVHCAQQAEAQNDPKVRQQFLELMRRWLLLAHGYESAPH
jgi:hypothetical protein